MSKPITENTLTSKGECYYICAILDLFSRKVVAYKISQNSSTYLVTSSFRKAYKDRGRPNDLMFHSDRGGQYTSKAFSDLLHMNNIVQSFSKSGCPHDNAVMESFFSSMKKEELYRREFKSERELRDGVDNFITFYNFERPHSKLSYKTPDEFEKWAKEKSNT